jgi:beta-galactosidase
MIELKNKQFIIDGKPVLIMCGEIHYYRLPIEEWEDRLNKLIESGCNAVATYVPWICHEETEGLIDLEGKTRPELNLVKFIDMCKDKGLYFFLRPGPFIMAEMKNEGIPYWVAKKHPEIVPTTWDALVTPNPTLDYLAPNFLKEVDKWYEAIMSITKPRLYDQGGNIIAIQLDNEIGMLTWVSNSPDLTDHVLVDFADWIKNKYDHETLKNRYPFSIDDLTNYKKAILSPSESYAANLLKDYGYYSRNRFARYVKELRHMAEKYGVKDIPFVINIHGTGGGRGLSFPIGISQLYETYQDEGYMSGSDIYFGDLTIQNFQDLYLINGFMDAVHNEHQPLSSVEFNCGDGNFGDNLGSRYDISASDFKARMCIAQGNRLINYYLMTGGYNYRLTNKPNDGNDRIAITGERHGFAAPINPEGDLSYTFPRMARSIKTIMANSEKLASMNEEHDNVAFGFIPDYFMTESYYPSSVVMKDLIKNLQQHRAGLAWETISKVMLLNNYRFTAVDIQNKEIDVNKTKVIVLASARYMSQAIQQKLVDFLNMGGSLLLAGELPIYDMETHPCTILADALGVTVKETLYNRHRFFMSVLPDNWAKGRAERRSHYAQTFESDSATPIYRVYHNNAVCGFEANLNKGKAIVFACELGGDLSLIKQTLERLGATKGISHNQKFHGLFITTQVNKDNERFIHILNLDGFDKEAQITLNNKVLFDGRTLLIQSKEGVMLPLNVTYNGVKINYSTAEVYQVNEHSIEFRLTQVSDVISIETDKEIELSLDYNLTKQNNKYFITSNKHSKVDNQLIAKFI